MRSAIYNDEINAVACLLEILNFDVSNLHRLLFEIFSSVSEDFTDRERFVLSLRIGKEPKTLEEIGDQIGTHGERVRQIIAKVIRKARNPLRRARLLQYLDNNHHGLLKFMDFADRDSLEERIKESKRERIIFEKVKGDPILSKSIGDLDLTTRTFNGLKSDGIEYVVDLVQKTEIELMQIPNFGRKSLAEIKNLLLVMDLSLGMILKPKPEEEN
jgi:hypothetical protein